MKNYDAVTNNDLPQPLCGCRFYPIEDDKGQVVELKCEPCEKHKEDVTL